MGGDGAGRKPAIDIENDLIVTTKVHGSKYRSGYMIGLLLSPFFFFNIKLILKPSV